MAKINYTVTTSLDGYFEDRTGHLDWSAPDEEVHFFINDLERDAGTYLYGRRMYETMAGWETEPALADMSPAARDYAGIWKAADKIVYSRTLREVVTSRTRIERHFDPDAVRRMLASADRDFSMGGAELAAHAWRAGLVGECRLFVVPIIIGGGRRAFPDDVLLPLELLEERRFASGSVYLRYRTNK